MHLDIRELVFLASLLFVSQASAQLLTVPVNDAEWRRFNQQVLDAFANEKFEDIVNMEPQLRKQLCDGLPMQYPTTICIARSLAKLSRHADAIPYYEQALRQDLQDYNVRHYRFSVEHQAKHQRGLDFAKELVAAADSRTALVDANLTFWMKIALGDDAYLDDRRNDAAAYYEEAAKIYERLPTDESKRDDWLGKVAKLAGEYTYYRLYSDGEGWKRHVYLTSSFLPQKLDMVKTKVPKKPQLYYRVALVVVRNTNVRYTNDQGKASSEKNYLDNQELEQYLRAWKFTEDAMRFYSNGRIGILSEKFDLSDATLTGLSQRNFKGIVNVRHLDPAQIMPPQDRLFNRVVQKFDCIVFVWDRGLAARAYGGGPIELPFRQTRLPARGGIRSMPKTSAICLHELLHNMTGKNNIPPVHGTGLDLSAIPGFQGNTETQWYTYLIANIPNYRPFKYQQR